MRFNQDDVKKYVSEGIGSLALKKMLKIESFTDPVTHRSSQRLYLHVHGFMAEPGLNDIGKATHDNREWGPVKSRMETTKDGILVVLEGDDLVMTRIREELKKLGWVWASDEEVYRFEHFGTFEKLSFEK